MAEDNDLSIRATVDSNSEDSASEVPSIADSETISIYDENTSLLRNNSRNGSDINKKDNKELLGLLLMTLSAFAFSTMSLCVKIGNKSYPFFQTVFARSIFQVIGGYIGCKKVKVSPWGHPDHYFILICKGAFGAVGMTLFFAGMTYLPLADNTVVFFTGPAITAIIAWIVLGEKLTILDGFLSLFSLFGVALVSRPGFLFSDNDNINSDDDDGKSYYSIFFLLPLIGATMGAFAYIIVRYIGNRVHFFVHVFYFGIVSTVISVFSLFVFRIQDPILPKSIFDWIIHILIAVSAFIGQCLLNRGLQLCAAGPGTLMRNLDVVFAFIFGITILGEVPKWTSVVGAIIIVGSSIIMGISKYIQKKRESLIAIAVSLEEPSEDEIQTV